MRNDDYRRGYDRARGAHRYVGDMMARGCVFALVLMVLFPLLAVGVFALLMYAAP